MKGRRHLKAVIFNNKVSFWSTNSASFSASLPLSYLFHALSCIFAVIYLVINFSWIYGGVLMVVVGRSNGSKHSIMVFWKSFNVFSFCLLVQKFSPFFLLQRLDFYYCFLLKDRKFMWLVSYPIFDLLVALWNFSLLAFGSLGRNIFHWSWFSSNKGLAILRRFWECCFLICLWKRLDLVVFVYNLRIWF